MVGVRENDDDVPRVLEPEKSERWEWTAWGELVTWARRGSKVGDEESSERKLFLPLLNLVRQRPGMIPTTALGQY